MNGLLDNSNGKIGFKDKEFPTHSVGKFLSRLIDKKLVQQPKRGIYQLPDRMFKEYILRLE